MKGQDIWGKWEPLPLLLLLIVVLFALYFLSIGSMPLAIALFGYSVILFQSRLLLSKIIRNFPGAPTIRRLVRTIIFFLPLPLLPPPDLAIVNWGILAGGGCGLLLLLFQLPTLKFVLSSEYIALLQPLSKEDKLRDVFHPILSAIAQEYFYRGVMLYILMSLMGLWSIVLVALLFAIEHVIPENAAQRFDRYDTLLHILLALMLGAVFYYSHSLVGCILGHLIYNGPGVIQVARTKLK